MDYSQSLDFYTDHYDSISRKFDDDFDDDFDDNDDDLMISESHNHDKQYHDKQQQQQSIHYTVIVPTKERLPMQERKDVKSVPMHHLEHLAKLREVREESFSSNESRSHFYPSDDTISTGLSEEDERLVSVVDIVRKFNGAKS
ncbi:unnamed protein product [Brugia pahangi]|uniref:Uncharacterized protein n=1 Tax=Brugia pahangi TaxID=6280 RepID=A0A0N4TGQ3_BRUPA|nr:unnamed protein product [Brugia pahangi]